MGENWITIDAERALYVDRGVNIILCDRLPSPVTLLVKISDEQAQYLRSLNWKVDSRPTPTEAKPG